MIGALVIMFRCDFSMTRIERMYLLDLVVSVHLVLDILLN